MQKRKILLVGGLGFIGHNLALTLNSTGLNEVFIIDNLAVNNFANLLQDRDRINRDLYISFLLERIKLVDNSGIKIYCEDARNYFHISKIINDIKPNVIIHLAAVAHANISNKQPHNTFDHSVRTLENVLDAVAKRDYLEQFVYFSSSMVYGDFQKEKVTEDEILNPKGIYGALKLGCEYMVKAYNQVFDFPYTIIRPSALYGKRCISRRVIQIFIENAINNLPIVVNGTGEEKLDFTYIKDLIQGIVLSIGNENAYNEIFNITYGNSRSTNDVISILSKFFDLKIKYEQQDKLTPKRGTLSIDKACNLLGYNPEYPIEDGINNYINFYKYSEKYRT